MLNNLKKYQKERISISCVLHQGSFANSLFLVKYQPTTSEPSNADSIFLVLTQFLLSHLIWICHQRFYKQWKNPVVETWEHCLRYAIFFITTTMILRFAYRQLKFDYIYKFKLNLLTRDLTLIINVKLCAIPLTYIELVNNNKMVVI